MNRPKTSEFEALLEREYQYQPQHVASVPIPPVQIQYQPVKAHPPPTDAEIAHRAIVSTHAAVGTVARGIATGFFKFVGGVLLLSFCCYVYGIAVPHPEPSKAVSNPAAFLVVFIVVILIAWAVAMQDKARAKKKRAHESPKVTT